MPGRTIIIRETIIQSPIKYNYALQPNHSAQVAVQPSYRHSLPYKPAMTKNEIIRS